MRFSCSAALHQGEFGCSDQAAGARRQHHVQADDVGLLQQRFLAGSELHPSGGAARGGEILAPGDHLHVQRLGDLGDLRAEPAEADQAECLALDVDAERALPGRPVLEALALVADPPRQLEHQGDGDAGGRIAGGFGRADHDAARLGGLEVQHEVALAGGDQELEVGQRLDQAARKRRSLARQHHHIEALERPGDLVGPAERGVEHRERDLACERGPVGEPKGDVLVVVEDGAAMERLG
jgi:hypothetical protein